MRYYALAMQEAIHTYKGRTKTNTENCGPEEIHTTRLPISDLPRKRIKYVFCRKEQNDVEQTTQHQTHCIYIYIYETIQRPLCCLSQSAWLFISEDWTKVHIDIYAWLFSWLNIGCILSLFVQKSVDVYRSWLRLQFLNKTKYFWFIVYWLADTYLFV